MLAQDLIWWVDCRPEKQWWAQIQADIKRGAQEHHEAIAAKKILKYRQLSQSIQ